MANQGLRAVARGEILHLCRLMRIGGTHNKNMAMINTISKAQLIVSSKKH